MAKHLVGLCRFSFMATKLGGSSSMSEASVFIQSYFTVETDLVLGLCEWAEFVSGDENEILLRSSSGEEVLLTHITEEVDGVVDKFVSVSSSECGPLFQRALGLTAYLLAEKGDLLIIHKGGENLAV